MSGQPNLWLIEASIYGIVLAAGKVLEGCLFFFRVYVNEPDVEKMINYHTKNEIRTMWKMDHEIDWLIGVPKSRHRH